MIKPEKMDAGLLERAVGDYSSKRELGNCDHETPDACPRCRDMESYVEHRLLAHIAYLSGVLAEIAVPVVVADDLRFYTTLRGVVDHHSRIAAEAVA